jgi:membrane protease YdiL (CAAX protease family)
MNSLRTLLLDPNENRPRSGWRLMAQTLLLLILTPLCAILLIPIGQLTPILAFMQDETFIALIAVTLSVWLARRWYDKRSFASLGLENGPAASRDLLAGILIGATLMGAIFAAEWGLGWLSLESAVQPEAQAASIGYWAAIFIMVGWYEELLARGYWLQNLRDGLGLIPAIVISSVVFGWAHAANPNANWVAVAVIVAAGVFFAFAYARSGQLWLPIGIHIGWNFFQGPVFGFPVSGIETARLLEHTVTGPELFTGGAFGPEAGLLGLAALLLGTLVVQLYAQRFAEKKAK